MTKPPYCKDCLFVKLSTGFVPDFVGEDPKMAVVLKMPGRDEIISGEPMTGKAGWYWDTNFLEPLGIKRENLIIGNTIRCFPNGGSYPTGKNKTGAWKACEHWCAAILKFQPQVIGVTFNPAALLRNPQQEKMLRRSMEKAWGYALAGERPLLLMGEEAKDLYASNLTGMIKHWQGHFFPSALSTRGNDA